MKKILSVLTVISLLALISVPVFSESRGPISEGYGTVKVGYGNETSGIGVGLEDRHESGLGWFAGLGYFKGYVGWAIGGKIHFADASDNLSFWLSGGYGLLGVRYTFSTSSGSSQSSIYGPFAMVGLSRINRSSRLFTDVGVGVGYNSNYGAILVLQSSIGLLIGD